MSKVQILDLLMDHKEDIMYSTRNKRRKCMRIVFTKGIQASQCMEIFKKHLLDIPNIVIKFH